MRDSPGCARASPLVSDVRATLAVMTFGPLTDRRKVAAARGMAIARAYETARGSEVYDASLGYDNTLRAVLRDLGCKVPTPPSADLIARTGTEVRIIEVKSRGGYGDIENVPERELETMRAAGPHSWLYVVFNATQRGPYLLVFVQDPANRLSWNRTAEALRPPGGPRGVQHEARFATDMSVILEVGIEVDLGGYKNLPGKPEHEMVTPGAAPSGTGQP